MFVAPLQFGGLRKKELNMPTITQLRNYQVDVQIRWMIRRDMPEVLGIEERCFEFSWPEENFLCYLRQRNCIGMVSEYQEKIIGFMVYKFLKYQIHILNFAVAPWVWRKSVGSQMVDKLIHKLKQQRHKEIILEVRESNLPAQLFFQEQGFFASGVLRDYYEDTEEDAYQMKYRLEGYEPRFILTKNRCSGYWPVV